jgi:aryl-alcohol dehydrogenase
MTVSKKITAAVVREPEGPFALEDVELGNLRPGEAYIKIQASGLCHTDLNMQHMLVMPAVVGHEGTGIVEEVGSGVLDVKPGDRVVISWPACGVCPNCLTGKRYLCEAQFPLLFGGRRLDGSTSCTLGGEPISACYFQQSSFATYAIAPAESLVVVKDDDVAPEILAALPCGAMTGAGSVLNELQVGPQDSFVSFGVGGVGQAAVMAAHLAGAYPIIAVARNPKRLELALELGATHTVNAKTDDVVARIKEIAPTGISHALDSSGALSSWATANEVLRMGGRFGVVAIPEAETLGGNTHGMLSKGIRIHFIMAGSAIPRVFIPKMIEWYKQGRFPVDKLIATFDFADINLAVAAANEGRAIKPVLLMP